MDNEHELLSRARAFDEQALAAIFDTFYRPLYRYLYHQTSHAQTAEDLTAKVFQRLLEAFHKGQGPKNNLKAWLFKVAHHLAVDEARQAVHRTHQPLDEEIAANHIGPEDWAQLHHETAQVQQALHQLTSQQRTVIILHFLEGLDNAEIAHVLQSTIGAVKALQHRALATLRRQLQHETEI